jgi:Uma2 family endonuclease
MIDMALHLTRRRFTAAEYHQMVEVGILAEDDRVELIEGEIIEMSPIGRRHAATVNRLNELFVHAFSDVALVGPQNPVQLSGDSEPQPDLALVRRRPDFYDSALPGAEDVFLVVEVSDTTVAYDRRLKIPLYGRNGITEAWLIDLNDQTITIYRDPGPAGYNTSQVVRRGDQVTVAAFPDRVLAVSDILG